MKHILNQNGRIDLKTSKLFDDILAAAIIIAVFLAVAFVH